MITFINKKDIQIIIIIMLILLKNTDNSKLYYSNRIIFDTYNKRNTLRKNYYQIIGQTTKIIPKTKSS